LPVSSRCDNLQPGEPQGGRPRSDCRMMKPSNRLSDARIRDLHRALERHRPRLLGATAYARASVGLLVRPAPMDLEILLIQRPVSDSDPWSGHMALPGGRRDGEEEPIETAIREVREEVGVDLEAVGMLIGRLDEVRPRRNGPQIAVAPFVFAVPADILLAPHPGEVAEVVWIPVGHLTEPKSAAEHLHPLPGGGRRRFPALAYHRHVIWGLTYRMLLQFLGIARSVRHGEVS
jgi:8-oxo-dGTP pyrophosphatase MutT (NUDIX family)